MMEGTTYLKKKKIKGGEWKGYLWCHTVLYKIQFLNVFKAQILSFMV